MLHFQQQQQKKQPANFSVPKKNYDDNFKMKNKLN